MHYSDIDDKDQEGIYVRNSDFNKMYKSLSSNEGVKRLLLDYRSVRFLERLLLFTNLVRILYTSIQY